MPFKKEAGKEFFQGVNHLKNYYKKIIENINSTPAQQLKAIAWLTYLCAETDEAKKIALLSLYTMCRKELQMKFTPADIDEQGRDIIANADDVLQYLPGGVK